MPSVVSRFHYLLSRRLGCLSSWIRGRSRHCAGPHRKQSAIGDTLAAGRRRSNSVGACCTTPRRSALGLQPSERPRMVAVAMPRERSRPGGDTRAAQTPARKSRPSLPQAVDVPRPRRGPTGCPMGCGAFHEPPCPLAAGYVPPGPKCWRCTAFSFLERDIAVTCREDSQCPARGWSA